MILGDKNSLFITRGRRKMQTILFFSYIAFISTLGTVLCIYDKTMARRGGMRVSERAICTCGIIGGAISMLLTMLCIRHKTQHTAIIVLMSTAALLWLLVYAIMIGVCIL